jgi:hypothetical protein
VSVDSWQRVRLTINGGAARVAMIALSPVDLPEPFPVSRKRHGMPGGESALAVEISRRSRTEHAAWFAGFNGSGLIDLIAEDLGADAAATALACDRAYLFEGELDDALDLGHIQAAWALAICACDNGAVIVVDVYAGRAWAAADVLALDPQRDFDFMREVTILADELGPETVVVFTRGLIKVGRPDLVAFDVPSSEAARAAHLLRDLGGSLAQGDVIDPGDAIELDDGLSLTVSEPSPAVIERLGLDQPALVLSGWK